MGIFKKNPIKSLKNLVNNCLPNFALKKGIDITNILKY